MTNEKKKTTREINLFVNDMFRVAKMFNEQGLELDVVLIENTDCNFKSKALGHKELDLHGSDMFKLGTTIVVKSQDDEKYYRAWYELKTDYCSWKLENWKLVQEKTEYK
jgi:hypothetical protein|tara:strand:+ start:410 stop:736 length:327 start_codon:yes stop_codon:yes gene_type:complete